MPLKLSTQGCICISSLKSVRKKYTRLNCEKKKILGVYDELQITMFSNHQPSCDKKIIVR